VASLPALERTVSFIFALLDVKDCIAKHRLARIPCFSSNAPNFPALTDVGKECLPAKIILCGRHRQILRLSLSGIGAPVKKRVEHPLRPGQEVLSRGRAVASGRQSQT
jgi:hypothetical protein